MRESPLRVAVARPRLLLPRQSLLERCAIVMASILATYETSSPLHQACLSGVYDAVAMLLDAQAEINATDNHGHTALHYATVRGHETIVTLLLSHQADPNLVGRDGVSPLMLAAAKGQLRVVRALLLGGADVNLVDGTQRTALFYATPTVPDGRLLCDNIMAELLNAGANPNLGGAQAPAALSTAPAPPPPSTI